MKRKTDKSKSESTVTQMQGPESVEGQGPELGEGQGPESVEGQGPELGEGQGPELGEGWAWTAEAFTEFSHSLLRADSLQDVLEAGLPVLLPTDIDGVTIMLTGGAPQERYIEIVAAWEREGEPALSVGKRLNVGEYGIHALLATGQVLVSDDLAQDDRVNEYLRSVLLQANVRALVALPLGTDEEYFGAIVIDRAAPRPFDRECVRIYKALAASCAGAVEKLRLIRETRRTLFETSALYEISRRLSESTSVNEILQTVLDSELFGAAGGTISLLEPATSDGGQDGACRELVFWAAAGAGAEDILGLRMPVSEGIVGWVVREGQAALVPDAYADERFYNKMDRATSFRTKSILCAPLRVERRVIGAIELVDLRPEYLTEEGVRLLGQVADQAALFIENQRLLNQTRRQTQDLSLLLDIGRDLASTLDREEALHLITSRAVALVGGDGCHVLLLQRDAQGDQVLVPIASSDRYAKQILSTTLRVGEGISGRVAQTGVGEIANRVDLDANGFQVPGTPLEPENLLSVPLISKGQVIGVMTVKRLGEEGFREGDLASISALAGHAATVLENTRLFEQIQQRSEELSALNAIVSTANQSLGLRERLETTLEQVLQVTRGQAGLVSLSDPVTVELRLTTQRDLPAAVVQNCTQDMRGTLCEVTAGMGETQYFPDLAAEDSLEVDRLLEGGLRSYLGTPLLAYGRVLGTLGVFSTEPNAFSEAEVTLLTSIGQQVGMAVRNAQLYEQTQQALKESTALYEASQEIANTPEVKDALQIAVNRMAEYVGTAQCQVVLFDEASGYGQIEAEYRPTPGVKDLRIPATGNPIYEVMRDTGRVIVIEDVHTHPLTAALSERWKRLGIKSRLLVPLMVKGHLVGSISLEAMETERSFTKSEIDFCRTLADRVALTLENSRLFTRTQSALQETRMLYQASRDLTQAHDLQDVLHAIIDNLPIERIDQGLIFLTDSEADSAIRNVEVKAVWDHEDDERALGMRFTSLELPFVDRLVTSEPIVVSDLEAASRSLEELDAQSIATLRAMGIKSATIVPLVTGGSLLGFLLLATHHQTLTFTPEQIRPYRALADQAAVAVQNQQLLQKVQASLQEVESVHRQYLRDEWSGFLRSQQEQVKGVVFNKGQLIPAQDLWNPLIGQAVSKNTLVVRSPESPKLERSDEDDDQSQKAGRDNGAGEGSSLIAPLQVRGQVLGALGLEDPEGEAVREWTAEEVSMVKEIADQVALAIENARLIEQTQANLAETEQLYRATGRLSDADSVEEVVQILAQEIQGAMGSGSSGVILRAGPDPTAQIDWLEQSAQWNVSAEQMPAGSRRAAPDSGMFARLMRQEDPVVIKTSELGPKEETDREMMAQRGLTSLTSIPLVAGESWLGMIHLLGRETGMGVPNERQMRFLQNLADRAAVTLESIRLYEETQRRAVQLEAAAKVSRAATSILDQERLLSNVVRLISDHFNYYHAQVFLVEPTGRWAILKASTGEIGQELLKRGHSLEVGGPSLIGYVTGTGEPRIAHDTDEDILHFRNELLPDTRSEMAIPLRVGDRVIGALDVQSTEPGVFGMGDIAVLSTLADQLTTAISNARLYQEQLETAEKLREVDMLKSQFLANMSHELRTPLNSIIGFSRVILKGIDGPLTDLQKQDLNAIYGSGQHLLGLINDILDLSKIESGKMELAFEETDLSEIVKGVMSTSVALFKDKPEVEAKHTVQPGMPLIIADATRIRQVLLNLVSNAAKFTEKGYVHLDATYDRRYVTIEVRDTGIGIPPEKFDVLFKEFEQVDSSSTRAYGGTGLGLPISKRFIEMHGGRIWVDSEVGVGSTFAVQLPIKGPQAVEEESDEFVRDHHRRLILAIDDDPETIDLYKRYLEEQAYQVFGMTTSQEAVEMAREWEPYAILLDLLMPQKDGWQIIRELKDDPETHDIPVIMCSIVSATGQGFSMGAADYLLKPISADELLESLARLADEQMLDAEQTQRVLVLDDTAEDRHLICRMLESAGETYEVLEASDGREGIEMIQQQVPDLVVLDLMMPGMDGFAVLEALKRDREMRRIPIIVVTAKELSEEERSRINGQAAALFQKGLFKQDDLLRDVYYVLHKMREHAKQEQVKE